VDTRQLAACSQSVNGEREVLMRVQVIALVSVMFFVTAAVVEADPLQISAVSGSWQNWSGAANAAYD